MTRSLVERNRLLDEVQFEAVVQHTSLTAVCNILGERDPHRVEVVVDERPGPVLEVAADLADACGVALAAALLEWQGTDCERWTVRVVAWDDEIGAWILLREWRSHD